MRWWVLALLGGCYKPDPLACNVRCDESLACPTGLTCSGPNTLCRGTDPCDPIIPDDGPLDGPTTITCPAGETLFGTGRGLLGFCLPTTDLGTAMIGGGFDTGFDCPLVKNEMCVIAGTDVTLANTLDFHGNRVLVIAATGTLTLNPDAELVVASSTSVSGLNGGPGATAPTTLDCKGPPGQQGPTVAAGGGGGAGGFFRTHPAGDGGDVGGVMGGIASTTDLAAAFHAGCPGGDGGPGGMGANMPGLGGLGGGAVYLLADQIVIGADASINASGGGGSIAALHGGGGGGGSGGFIGLDAATSITIDPTAQLFAIGGGGSSGGSNAGSGNIGLQATAFDVVAPQAESVCGGNGIGAVSAMSGGDSTASACGGGGGGGGDGMISIAGTVVSGVPQKVRPAPQRIP